MKFRRSERPHVQPTPEAEFEARLLRWFWRSSPGDALEFELTSPHTFRGLKVRVNRLARMTRRDILWAPRGEMLFRVESIG
jgi:hypothetical protein